MSVFLQDLEISRPTFHRDIVYLRDRFNAPIEYDRSARGYRFNPAAERFELPGIWFTAKEAHALLTFQYLLTEVQAGLLRPMLQTWRHKLEQFFDKGETSLAEVQRRIRILSIGHRDVIPNYFELISHAVLTRKRLHIEYYNRERDETSARDISPQRLVYYRNNWYLDSYDHVRSALRTFSLDSLRGVQLQIRPVHHIGEQQLNEELGSGYGIFAGKKTQTAHLCFSPIRARWVAKEQWHPQQKGHWQEDGSYLLEIPYSDDRELLMDILRYGSDVEVLSPKNLRARVRDRLREAAKIYEK